MRTFVVWITSDPTQQRSTLQLVYEPLGLIPQLDRRIDDLLVRPEEHAVEPGSACLAGQRGRSDVCREQNSVAERPGLQRSTKVRRPLPAGGRQRLSQPSGYVPEPRSGTYSEPIVAWAGTTRLR